MNDKVFPKELIGLEERLKKRLILESKKRENLIAKRKKMIGFAACIAITFSIGIKPIASFVNNKIDENKIAQVSGFDSGIIEAVENGIIQEIDKEMLINGLKFTLQNIIADESGMMVFYTIENLGDYEKVKIDSAYLRNKVIKDDILGYQLDANVDYNIKNIYKYDSSMIFDFEDTNEIKDMLLLFNLSVKKSNENYEKVSYDIPINLKEEIFKGKIMNYDISKTANIRIGDIKFENLKRTPMRNSIAYDVELNQGIELLGFESMYLIDENGNTYDYKYQRENKLYFDSSFYDEGSDYRLIGGKIQYIDANHSFKGEIDLEKEQFVGDKEKIFEIENIEQKDRGYKVLIRTSNTNFDSYQENLDISSRNFDIESKSISYIENIDQTFIEINIDPKDKYIGDIFDFEIRNYPKNDLEVFDIQIDE